MKNKLLLLAAITFVWWGGSTWWYICKIQYLCSAKAVTTPAPAATKPAQTPPVATSQEKSVTQTNPPKTPEPVKTPDVVPSKPGSATLYFLPDSTNYRDGGATALLDPIAAYLKAVPNAKASVAGHTTNLQGTVAGEQLATERANQVAKYLTEHGANSSQLSVTAVGDREQVGDTTTEQGQSNNRRVVVTIQ